MNELLLLAEAAQGGALPDWAKYIMGPFGALVLLGIYAWRTEKHHLRKTMPARQYAQMMHSRPGFQEMLRIDLETGDVVGIGVTTLAFVKMPLIWQLILIATLRVGSGMICSQASTTVSAPVKALTASSIASPSQEMEWSAAPLIVAMARRWP